MSVIIKDPKRCDLVCFQRLKGSSCHPCCPPVCCYPVPPSGDPFWDCCKRTPPKCNIVRKKSREDICPPDLVPHSGPLPCEACYACHTTACCRPTFAGKR